jgi:broad specificity phosphatase PhoE
VRKQFYILRHGLTASPGVLLGQFDTPLSEEGARQAQQAAAELAAEGIERVVSSALARARETAGWIAERLGLETEIDERLNEISYGRWDGLRWEQIEQDDPATAGQKLKDWWSATPSGGEPATAFVRRVEQAWISLLDNPASITVVVAHEAVNAVLVELSRRQPGCDNEAWQPDWKRVSNFRQQAGAYRTLSVETQ